jgi:hypothetical protein
VPCPRGAQCFMVHPDQTNCLFGYHCRIRKCRFRHSCDVPWINIPAGQVLAVPCPDFYLGCPRGKDCPLRHCSLACRNGVNCQRPICTYIHPGDLVERQRRECPKGGDCPNIRRGCLLFHRTRICRRWLKYGRCDFGDACGFRHDSGYNDNDAHLEMEMAQFVNTLL